ncbi:MAG: low molecular weight phosphatase family protein [Hyphomicrobiaceae bacterium]|nr:low molecular weight phosphatase family protein [Hyphomicrobiaceae bacterium]
MMKSNLINTNSLTPRPLPGAVLFACTMNSVRSPMAAGILRHLAARNIYIESAGVRTGQQDPFVTNVMEEIGIDVSKHRPVAINDLFDSNFDLIITLTPEAHHQALELTRTMSVDVDYWPTLDPTFVTGNREQVLQSYRTCRDTLLGKIKTFFNFERAQEPKT